MKASVCPICKGPRQTYSKNPAHPFCSRRCKLADLSNWFSESYKMPAEHASSEDDAGADSPPKTIH